MKLKPGITTTEFWTTIGATVVQGLLAAGGMIDGTYAAFGITLLNLLYPLLRTALKNKSADTPEPPKAELVNGSN